MVHDFDCGFLFFAKKQTNKQKQPIVQGSHTLGKSKKPKNSQRHSAGNIDYDNIHGSQEGEDIPIQVHTGFRVRSKTVGDSSGKCKFNSTFSKLFVY